ncbi:hypothetical protein REIS_0996 [Rickettsia endosymbiont of Ixodes scapularis]|nr:hypothetical protein REIS_0996 [Rickettsia endosymbiont of Ixodes scapularis]
MVNEYAIILILSRFVRGVTSLQFNSYSQKRQFTKNLCSFKYIL